MDVPYKKRGRVSKCPAPEFFGDLYAAYTSKELGQIYGVKESTVRSWACRMRKEARKKEEGNEENEQ